MGAGSNSKTCSGEDPQMTFETPPRKRIRSSLPSSPLLDPNQPLERLLPVDPPPRLSLEQVLPRAIPLVDVPIDKLLNGGIYTRRVTEICGASATGKTIFCLCFCLAAQSSDNRKIYWVNSESTVILKRLQSIKARYPDSDLDQVLALQRPIHTEEGFLGLVMSERFEDLFRGDSGPTTTSAGAAAVIIDTLPYLQIEQVIQVLDRLRSLAVTYDTAVIITNGMVGTPEKNIHQLDGQSWSQVRPHVTGTQPGPGWTDSPRMGWTLTRNVDTRILLTRNGDKREMKVLYSGDTNCGSTLFKVTDLGLVGL